MSTKPTISEVIVVEGKHDALAVRRAVNAEIFVVFGLSVKKHIEVIKKYQEDKGVIVFTDPDRNGEKIRKYIDTRVPGAKHACLYRKDAIGENHRIGVEYANEGAIITAVQNAKATFLGNTNKQCITNESVLTDRNINIL